MEKYPGLLRLLHYKQVLLDRFFVVVHTAAFKIKLKFNGCIYGKYLRVYGKVFFKAQYPGRLIIGSNFTINSSFNSNLVGLTNYGIFQIIEDGKIEIGDHCGFSAPVLSSRQRIKIGNYVLIGGNVRIFDHDYHSLNYLNRRNPEIDRVNVKAEEVVIEDDVFIGTNSIILKGVHIGARSIIGAGSVVTLKNIPPDSLVIGNPAIIIKKEK